MASIKSNHFGGPYAHSRAAKTALAQVYNYHLGKIRKSSEVFDLRSDIVFDDTTQRYDMSQVQRGQSRCLNASYSS